MTDAPTICLNMIVRNESHVIRELLDTVEPYIHYWVIVDTGSDDGTQALIRNHFAERGVPGELHERPWRNFGANRTEALQLAQGRANYIWVMDADDSLVGTPDFSNLTDGSYEMRFGPGITYWRRQIFRDGLPWHYKGVLHEYSTCDEPSTTGRVAGDYYVESRRLGARNQDPEKYLRDAEILLAEVERNPDDERSVFYLAQSYFDHGDMQSARQWYLRRAEMGCWAEEVYYSLNRVAECSSRLDDPWPMVQEAHLKAWASRPTRAEPLCAIASHYLGTGEWALGYLFAQAAAQIPMPDDKLFVSAYVYNVSARDVQAVCAYWLGKHQESFGLCRTLLARSDLDDGTRARIATNRDFCIPAMIAAAATYPEPLTRQLIGRPRGSGVTVTLISGANRVAVERTLNSILNCCSDIQLVDRFLLIDLGLSNADFAWLSNRYPFLERTVARAANVAGIYRSISTRFWLHLGEGWEFFAPEALIGRLIAVLEAEPDIGQVGINLDDAKEPSNSSAAQEAVRSHGNTGRYLLTNMLATGPAMYDTTRFNPARATGSSRAATLDEVLSIKQR